MKINFIAIVAICLSMQVAAAEKENSGVVMPMNREFTQLATTIAFAAINNCLAPQGESKQTCYRIAAEAFSHKAATSVPELRPSSETVDAFADRLTKRALKIITE